MFLVAYLSNNCSKTHISFDGRLYDKNNYKLETIKTMKEKKNPFSTKQWNFIVEQFIIETKSI